MMKSGFKVCPVVGLCLVIWPVLLVCASETPPASPDHAQRMEASRALFKQKVAAILQHRCVRCHGQQQAKGGLDLSTRAALHRLSHTVVDPQCTQDPSPPHQVTYRGRALSVDGRDASAKVPGGVKG